MLKFLKIRNVKSPERAEGNCGIDFFVPEYSKEFIEDLRAKNKKTIIVKDYTEIEKISLEPHQSILIPSGIKSYFDGNIALIATNKSGQATKKRLQVGATCVDPNYRGEIHLSVYNSGTEPILIEFGEKLVQFIPYFFNKEGIVVEEGISEEEFYGEGLHTEREDGGFGSTGTTGGESRTEEVLTNPSAESIVVEVESTDEKGFSEVDETAETINSQISDEGKRRRARERREARKAAMAAEGAEESLESEVENSDSTEE